MMTAMANRRSRRQRVWQLRWRGEEVCNGIDDDCDGRIDI